MESLHSLLRRQLKRHGLVLTDLPRPWRDFIASVDAAYRQSDDDRATIERSLDLSSQELLQANAELRALFQAIPDLLFRLDVDGRIVDCRGGMGSSFFLPPRDLIGKKFGDIPYHGLGARFAELLQRVHELKTVLSAEYTLPMPDGERHYEARFIPMPDGQTITIVRDITQRRRDEEELYRSRQMLQLVLDNIPQRVFWKDRECRYLGANRSFAKDAEVDDPQELIGRTDDEMPWRVNAEHFRADDREVMESGRPKLSFEEPMDRPDGTRTWMRTSKAPLVDQQGQVFGVLGTFEDITAQKQAAEALRQSEERYRIATENTGQLIYDLNTETGEFSWAGAVEALTGYSPEEFAHVNVATLAEMIHPDDSLRVSEALSMAMQQGTGFHAEYRLRRRNGSYIPIEDTGAFVSGGEGQPIHMFGAMKDISERMQVQEERQRAEERLRQAAKMEAIGRLAGGVAHDFNNILTGIVGYAELLMDSLDGSDPMLAEVSEIHRAAGRAASLTAQLLAFSRRQIIDPRVLDLNELVNSSSRMIERLIGEDVHLSLAFGDNLGRVRADRGQIEQVLVNLAINARDAMAQGGRLTIETANVELNQAFCAKYPDATPGPYVMLSVADTGVGMSPETLEHLFEPFFTTKERGRGTGLGLSTVYGIARQNGGLVTAHSELGRGSIFRLYLPRVASESEEQAPSTGRTLPSGRETVLLVEDEEVVRTLANKILSRQGYRVTVATDGAQACEIAEETNGHFDLLLTDVIMPGMNGKQLYERLRANQPDLKVLYMSGYTEETIAHRGLLEPGTNFVQKPFSLETLTRRVREVLDK